MEFIVTDPDTGRKLKMTGDSPPSEKDIEAAFSQAPAPQEPMVPKPEDGKKAPPSILQRGTRSFLRKPTGEPPGFDVGDIVEFLAAEGPTIGASIKGGAMGAKMGAPIFPPFGAIGGGMIGAGLGAAGARAGQRVARRLATPDEQDATIGEDIKDVTAAGAAGAIGEGSGQVGSAVLKSMGSRLPSVFRNAFGTADEATARALERPQALNNAPDATMEKAVDIVKQAKSGMDDNINRAGELINKAEEELLERAASGEGIGFVDMTPLKGSMDKIIDKVTGGIPGAINLLSGPEIATIKSLKKVIGSGGPAAIRGVLQLKRLIDSRLKFGPVAGGIGDVLGKELKVFNNGLRRILRGASPELRKASKAFELSKRVKDRFGKMFGVTKSEAAEGAAEVRATKALRSKFFEGESAQNVVKAFDESMAQVEKILGALESRGAGKTTQEAAQVAKGVSSGRVDDLFDAFTALEFSAQAPKQLSPSSPLMRAMSMVGVNSPQIGRAILRGGGAASEGARAAGRAARIPAQAGLSEAFLRFLQGEQQ